MAAGGQPFLILHSASPGERRTALLRGDMLEDFAVERPARPDGVGDLHLGRVGARVPALSGIFVTLAGEESGFLPDNQGGEGLSEGQAAVVRILRAAQGGKGPRLDRKVPRDVAAEGPPRRLRRGPPAVERLAASHPAAAIRTDDPETAATLRAAGLGDRVTLARRGTLFEDAVEAAIERLLGHEVPLEGGGRLLIHPTPALVAIDVDTGAATRDRGAQRRVNEAALREAARQIRLRQLAGPILIDLAGLAPAARAEFVPALKSAAGGDRLLRILGTTALGLIETVRTRVHPPLHEVLGLPPTPLSHGLAALRRALREAESRPGAALALRAHPAVLRATEALDGTLEEYRRWTARALALRPDPALLPGEEVIEDA
ncbi:ribonuclease E/G [Roseomonas elaeocarpi]|uniref:Ribonuclease E/G n=1 Tax=Roseomonas elaeocarpi TaxID=907779 RepID=A0ABV6JVP3_9PROT